MTGGKPDLEVKASSYPAGPDPSAPSRHPAVASCRRRTASTSARLRLRLPVEHVDAAQSLALVIRWNLLRSLPLHELGVVTATDPDVVAQGVPVDVWDVARAAPRAPRRSAVTVWAGTQCTWPLTTSSGVLRRRSRGCSRRVTSASAGRGAWIASTLEATRLWELRTCALLSGCSPSLPR
jgi:hypothetical protein